MMEALWPPSEELEGNEVGRIAWAIIRLTREVLPAPDGW
jgi:hypothetical protein